MSGIYQMVYMIHQMSASGPRVNNSRELRFIEVGLIAQDL